MVDWLTVEFHCHTAASADCLTPPADLVRVCATRGIDRLIVTDHNTISGAHAARALDPQRIIVGEEIMTTRGELLAAYVREEVPKGLEPLEAIRRLREQGAFISVSHPFDRFRSGGWREDDLLAILPHVDAIETFNSRCIPASFNQQAAEFARAHNLLGTVGSDAHSLKEVGRATQNIPPFHDANSLKESLSHAMPRCRRSGFGVRLASRYAVLARRMGWEPPFP